MVVSQWFGPFGSDLTQSVSPRPAVATHKGERHQCGCCVNEQRVQCKALWLHKSSSLFIKLLLIYIYIFCLKTVTDIHQQPS